MVYDQYDGHCGWNFSEEAKFDGEVIFGFLKLLCKARVTAGIDFGLKSFENTEGTLVFKGELASF